MAAFSLLIASIGFDPISGFPRFTFGMMEMMEGPPFILTLIGLFAVSEVFNEVQKTGQIQQLKANLDRFLPIWADIKYCFKHLCRSSFIGTSSAPFPAPGATLPHSFPTARPSALQNTRNASATERSRASPPAKAPTTPVPAAP